MSSHEEMSFPSFYHEEDEEEEAQVCIFRALDTNQHRSNEKDNGEHQVEILEDDLSGKMLSQGLETSSIDSPRSAKPVDRWHTHARHQSMLKPL